MFPSAFLLANITVIFGGSFAVAAVSVTQVFATIT